MRFPAPAGLQCVGCWTQVSLTLPPSLVNQVLKSRPCSWGSLCQDAMWLRLLLRKHDQYLLPKKAGVRVAFQPVKGPMVCLLNE